MTGRDVVETVKSWAAANPIYVREILAFVVGFAVGAWAF